MTNYDSFLEFVAARLLGPAVSGSYWNCPFCDSSSASLSVRPPKAGYKVKFKCFRCATWGDQFDLMKEFYPGEDYPRRRVRLDSWRRDYEAELEPDADPSSSPRGQQEPEQSFDDWVIDIDQRHLAECDDSECSAIICRAERGLPPMMKGEREQEREEREQESEARSQRIRANIQRNIAKMIKANRNGSHRV